MIAFYPKENFQKGKFNEVENFWIQEEPVFLKNDGDGNYLDFEFLQFLIFF